MDEQADLASKPVTKDLRNKQNCGRCGNIRLLVKHVPVYGAVCSDCVAVLDEKGKELYGNKWTGFHEEFI